MILRSLKTLYYKYKEKDGLLGSFWRAAHHAYKKFKTALKRSENRNLSRLFLRLRSLKRRAVSEKFTFVSMEDLALDTTEWIKSFPDTYDIVLGIPRSGLLIAGMVALKLGKPLSTLRLFCENRVWISNQITTLEDPENYKNILLVDDVVSGGATIKNNLEFLKHHNSDLNITTACMYIERQSPLLPDLYHEILPGLGLFEWNVLHSKKTDTLVSDLDGVICEDCAPEIDSNEELYCEWIKNAKPYLIPAFEIDVILSSRLEKYRHATEEWLNRHRVKYKKLILWDIPSKEERKGNFAKFKIDQLIKIKPGFIWESNSSESEQIWKATKTPTLCVDEMILFN